MNRAPDPRKYNMYAAFRTKERGEEKARAKRESIYELNRPKRSAAPSQTHTKKPSAGIYHVSHTKRPTPPQEQPKRPPVRQGVPTADTVRRPSIQQGTQATVRRMQSAAQQREAGIYNAPASRTPSAERAQTTQSTQRGGTPTLQQSAAAKTKENAVTVGTRVQNKGEEAYRYGFHSSYRTSDGRILDGFDKTGRPIYRESGASAVVRHVGSDVDVAKLHPVRRIRVETHKDTKKKPFPFTLVLIMVFCTAMVMGVLYAYMRLNECTGTLSTLNYKLSLLRNETNTLTAEVVRREDLIAIEQTAADTLGMVKNDVLTKRYVSIENEDKTEIFDNNAVVEEEHETVKIDLKTGEIITETEAATNETAAEDEKTEIKEE